MHIYSPGSFVTNTEWWLLGLTLSKQFSLRRDDEPGGVFVPAQRGNDHIAYSKLWISRDVSFYCLDSSPHMMQLAASLAG